MRPSWVEVDLEAIRHNTEAISSWVAPSILCAVVKADAYGHGDVPVAEAALAGGAGFLAVALVEEAARLREAGITAPILLLSEPDPAAAREVVALGAVATVYGWSFASQLAAEAAAADRAPYPVHLKVDTGMHRVGTSPPDALDLAGRIAEERNLSLQGLWTHFAVSEEDAEFTREQVEGLGAVREKLSGLGIEPPTLHAANTAAALDMESTRLDMVRVGLGLYGLRPAPAVGAGLSLRPAMRVVSRVSHVRRLTAGDRPSYGRRRPLPADATVATVPIGYADGISRRLASVGGSVLIGGRRHPFAGSVTMDQIVVDCGDVAVAVGDEVVVLGRQGAEEITAEEWARLLDTINYEIVCHFGPRLPRRYVGEAR